jgi:hypothetical protein
MPMTKKICFKLGEMSPRETAETMLSDLIDDLNLAVTEEEENLTFAKTGEQRQRINSVVSALKAFADYMNSIEVVD